MIINDCQLNEMFENYADYAESVKDNINEDTVDAFQMSAALAILLKSDKNMMYEQHSADVTGQQLKQPKQPKQQKQLKQPKQQKRQCSKSRKGGMSYEA